MTKQVRTVQFKTSEKTVEIPQALAQTLRGVSISARPQPIAHAVAKGIDEDISVVFDQQTKRIVLRIIYVLMQTDRTRRRSNSSSYAMRCGPISPKADAAAAADLRGRGSQTSAESEKSTEVVMAPRSGAGLPSMKRTTGIEPATLSLGS